MNELKHHGILGMKWGVRRYQNKDGTLTEAGKARYSKLYGDAANVARKNIESTRSQKEKAVSYLESQKITPEDFLRRQYGDNYKKKLSEDLMPQWEEYGKEGAKRNNDRIDQGIIDTISYYDSLATAWVDSSRSFQNLADKNLGQLDKGAIRNAKELLKNDRKGMYDLLNNPAIVVLNGTRYYIK